MTSPSHSPVQLKKSMSTGTLWRPIAHLMKGDATSAAMDRDEGLLAASKTEGDEVEASIYVRLCYEIPRVAASKSEVGALMGRCRTGLTVFRLSEASAENLAIAIGGFEPDAWIRMRGADLVAGREPRCVFHDGLRYCAECMRFGWHSILFQHRLVRTCPLHGCPLRTGCPNCQLPIVPTLSYVAVNPMCCGACGASLTCRFPKSREEVRTHGPPSGAFNVLRRQLNAANTTIGSAAGSTDWRFETRIPMDHRRCPNAAFVASRHVDWERPFAFPTRQHRTFQHRVSWSATSSHWGFAADALSAAASDLRSLTTRCDMLVGPQHCALISRTSSSGLIIDAELSVVAAAFILTLKQSGDKFHRAPTIAARSSIALLLSRDIHRVIGHHEMVALMARNLIYTMALSSAAEVDWQRQVPPELVVPGWRLTEVDNGWVLSIRPVCSDESLVGLLKRVRPRRLSGRRLPKEWLTHCAELAGPWGDDRNIRESGSWEAGQAADKAEM